MTMMEQGANVESKRELVSEIETAVIDDAEMIHVMTSGTSETVTLPFTFTQGGLMSIATAGHNVCFFFFVLCAFNNNIAHFCAFNIVSLQCMCVCVCVLKGHCT